MSVRSIVPGIAWPAIPDHAAATQLALAWQLEQSQWWSADELAAQQAAQRALVLAHARATVPHYAGLGERWEDVLESSRGDGADRRRRGAPLSRGFPREHGAATEIFTSRTTGSAVTLRATAVTAALWNAMTLREHAWHGRDLNAKLAAIRHVPRGEALPPDGVHHLGWGPATRTLALSAPCAVLAAIHGSTTEDHARAWLVREALGVLDGVPDDARRPAAPDRRRAASRDPDAARGAHDERAARPRHARAVPRRARRRGRGRLLGGGVRLHRDAVRRRPSTTT